MEAVLGGAGGLGALGGGALPLGSNDLAPSAPQSAPSGVPDTSPQASLGLPVPGNAF